jgi:ketosteroid isomerase-like protein
MRKFRRNKSFGFVVCLIAGSELVTTGCYSQSAARQYIEDAEKRWAESVPTNDASILKRILAEDFVWVYPSDGRLLWSKAETIADAEAGPGDFVSNHVNEVNVRFFGMTAVAQGNESWVQKDKSGKEIKGRFIWSDVWVRRHGQWQMVQAQDQAIDP